MGTPPPARGEQHPQAKLTWAAVRAIRQRYLAGETLRELGAAYSVTPTNIQAVVLYRSWWPDPIAPSASRPAPVNYRSRPRRRPAPLPAKALLTWPQARAIRERFRHSTVGIHDLAAEYRVSPEVMRRVVAFQSYWPEPGGAATPRPAPLQSLRLRSPRGEQTSGARLTWAQVRILRARYAAGGISLGQLARGSSVNVSTVSRIVHRQNWWPDPGENAASVGAAVVGPPR